MFLDLPGSASRWAPPDTSTAIRKLFGSARTFAYVRALIDRKSNETVIENSGSSALADAGTTGAVVSVNQPVHSLQQTAMDFA